MLYWLGYCTSLDQARYRLKKRAFDTRSATSTCPCTDVEELKTLFLRAVDLNLTAAATIMAGREPFLARFKSNVFACEAARKNKIENKKSRRNSSTSLLAWISEMKTKFFTHTHTRWPLLIEKLTSKEISTSVRQHSIYLRKEMSWIIKKSFHIQPRNKHTINFFCECSDFQIIFQLARIGFLKCWTRKLTIMHWCCQYVRHTN